MQILRVDPEISGFVTISPGQSPGQPFLRVGDFDTITLPYMDVFGRVFCKNEGLFLTKTANLTKSHRNLRTAAKKNGVVVVVVFINISRLLRLNKSLNTVESSVNRSHARAKQS